MQTTRKNKLRITTNSQQLKGKTIQINFELPFIIPNIFAENKQL
jgi:hypothetical protein